MKIWHRHNWTDWAIKDRGDVLWFNNEPVGWYIVQERYCSACGKTQVDEQSSHGGHSQSWCHRVSTIGPKVPRKDGVKA